MDTPFAALAAKRCGFFTRGDALQDGIGDRELSRAVRRGVLRRVRHGCYAGVSEYAQLDDVAQHLLLARAVLSSQQGEVALTGPTAAALHGLSTYGQPLGTVHLVRLDQGSSRHEVGTRHHVLTHDISRDLTTVAGLPVVNVARTVWEVATVSSLEAAVCTADSALRLYPGIDGALQTIAATFSRRPGSRRARTAVTFADGRAASEGESLSRILFARHQIPPPDLQHEVVDHNGVLVATTDFGWSDFNHVGEFDGKVKYTRYLRPGEQPGDAVFREKKREDAVRAQGLGMTRWTWRDITPAGAPEFIVRLREDLSRSGSLSRRRSA